MIDINKLLMHASMIQVGSECKWYVSFLHEMLPNFCYLCGMLNHIERDCELGFEIHDRLEDARAFKPQIRVGVNRNSQGRKANQL